MSRFERSARGRFGLALALALLGGLLVPLVAGSDDLDPSLMPDFAYPPDTLAYAEIHGSLPKRDHIAEYDRAMAAAKSAVERRAAQVAFLLLTRSDPIEVYRQMRAERPVFPLPDLEMVLVTRDRDVRQVLDNPTVFSVREYRDRMEPVVGAYMLSRDSHPYYNIEEKPWMRSLMRRSDLARIRQIVRNATAQAIATQTIRKIGSGSASYGVLDVVAALGRGVPVRLVQEYFGFRAPTPDMLRWSFSTQDSFFHNVAYLRGIRGFAVRNFGFLAPDVQPAQIEALRVHRAAFEAADEMRAFLDAYVESHAAGIRDEDTVLSRMLAVNDGLAHPKEWSRLRSNVMGGLIGAVETSNAAVVQSLHQLLRRPGVLARARAAAARVGPEDAIEQSEFAGFVWEALRFHPINPFVVRWIEDGAVIGDGASSVKLEAGHRVLAATYSAMHDPRRVESPDDFRQSRPERDREMNLGYAMHRCLGDRIAQVMIPEILRQLVLLPDLEQLAPSPTPALNFGIDFGPRESFPERYWIRFDADAAGSMLSAAAAM